jgi:hypothetical protein
MILEDVNDEFHPRLGRVLFYDLKKGTVTPVADIIQKDYNGNPVGTPGDWETSGVINMADILGHHQWLIVTQAHSLKVDIPQLGGKDESGQLMLLTVPGSANSN